MNPGGSSFARCVQHPSQFFTGFCSSCLLERLSAIDSVQRSPKPSSTSRRKKSDCHLSSSESGDKPPPEVRVRKSLLSLFHLDDSSKEECVSQNHGGTDDNPIEQNFNSESGVSASNLKSGLRRQHSYSKIGISISPGVGNSSNDDFTKKCAEKNHCSMKDERLKEKSVSFWMGWVFKKKLMKWRTRSGFGNSSVQRNWIGENQPDFSIDFGRRSYDCKLSCDLEVGNWEDPRHSWDCVTIDKSVATSFAGVGEAVDRHFGDTSELEWRNSAISHRRRASLPEEADLGVHRLSIDGKDANAASLASSDSSHRVYVGDVSFNEPWRGATVQNSRRKTNRWCKAWSRSITVISPFRYFTQKHENSLQRSLSESWRRHHGRKNLEPLDTGGSMNLDQCSMKTAKHQQNTSRINYVGNSHLQQNRCHRQNKRGQIFSRSRSVHYPSPGNLDSGLLRFYLTPLRSSRRLSSRRKVKSRSFARNVLGI